MAQVVKLRSGKKGFRFAPVASIGRRAAASAPTSYNPADRTFEFVLATEKPCRTYRWAGWDVVEVDEILPMAGLIEIEKLVRASILNSHASWNLRDVIGVVTSARVEGDKLICTGQLSDRTDVADVARDIETGILNSMSVGFEVVEDGIAIERAGDVPLVRVRKWKALEASVVPVPADDDAKIRGARRASRRSTTNGARAMTPEELKSTLTTIFAAATDEIVTALTVDDGSTDLEAEADAAAEEARAAFLASKGKAGGSDADGGARSKADKAIVDGLRAACKSRGLATEFDVLDKAGATVAELRGVLSAGLRTSKAEIDGTSKSGSGGGNRSGKLVSFNDSAAKRGGKK